MKRQRNKDCAYTGLVGAKLRIPVRRRTVLRGKRKMVRLTGGPLDGHSLCMDAAGGGTTLQIAVRGQVGRYLNGTWTPDEPAV